MNISPVTQFEGVCVCKGLHYYTRISYPVQPNVGGDDLVFLVLKRERNDREKERYWGDYFLLGSHEVVSISGE